MKKDMPRLLRGERNIAFSEGQDYILLCLRQGLCGLYVVDTCAKLSLGTFRRVTKQTAVQHILDENR